MSAQGLAVVAACALGVLLILVKRPRGQKPAGCTVVPKYGSLGTASPDEISLLTWNILADAFSSSHSAWADADALRWERRWPLIQRTIAAACADIVCLQEVDVARLEEVLSCPACHGYQALVQPTRGREVVCVTLAAPRLTPWWEQSRSRALLGAWTFEDSGGALQAVYVANLHLEGHPRKARERVAQLRNALQAMQAHQREAGLPPDACNVVVAGDFNSSPGEACGRFVLEGRLEAGEAERGVELTSEPLEHPYLLRDAYRAAGVQLPFTRKVPGHASTLDYVYSSSHMAVQAVLQPLSPADRRDPGGCPNRHCPSDHIPLGVRLRCLPAL